MKYLVVLLGLGLLGACPGDVSTPFPAGLEPLEDNIVPTQQGGAYTETLRTMTMETDYIHVYGRGYALVDPATVWLAAKNPDANIAVCSTNSQIVTLDDQPEYEFSFLVHYVVNDVLTIEWDDQWRYGTIEGTQSAPTLAISKHQKTEGSAFIRLSEGTAMFTPTADDPNVTELAFIERLNAAGGTSDDVIKGMQHQYDALVAAAHGNPLPACP